MEIWYIYLMEYYSVIKNTIMKFIGKYIRQIWHVFISIWMSLVKSLIGKLQSLPNKSRLFVIVMDRSGRGGDQKDQTGMGREEGRGIGNTGSKS